MRRVAFCGNFIAQLEERQNTSSTFDLYGIIGIQNMHIWVSKNPHASVKFVHDSPEVNMFCALCKDKVYGPPLLHRMHHYQHDMPTHGGAVAMVPLEGGLFWPFNLPAAWDTTPLSFGCKIVSG